jgi:hypothetical protein
MVLYELVNVSSPEDLGGRDWLLVSGASRGIAFVAEQCDATSFRDLAEALGRAVA